MKFRSSKHSRSRSYTQPTLRFLPLGGMGEVTRNLYVYEYFDPKKPDTSDILLVDCGMGFPDEEMLGVDLVLPDISYLRERKDRLRGLVITHGHMDHIGAIPFVLPELEIPVYATRLTVGFIREELRDRGIQGCQVNEVTKDSTLDLGPFKVSFAQINHSIPDAVAVVIKTPVGTLIHTGDFKFDWTPVMVGQEPEVGKLAHLGKEGVQVLFSDCLRIEHLGYTLSEKMITKTFDDAMSVARGRVLITTFSSNISRIQQAVDVSRKYNRKICFVGRSMENYSRVAAELGYLNYKKRQVVPLKKLDELPLNHQTLLVAGSQAQRYSALSRIARGEHKWIKAKKGDLVIFSSDSIPGNEAAVNNLIDLLMIQDMQVIYSATTDDLHVSGHASREELKLLLGLTKPKHVVPISGSFRHMRLMAELAEEMGSRSFVLRNGETLEITDQQVSRGKKIEIGEVLMDGDSIGKVGKMVLEDRRILSDDGLIVVVALVDEGKKEVLIVDIITRGFVFEEGDRNKRLRDGLRSVVKGTLKKNHDQWKNKKKLDQKLAKALRDHVFKNTKLRPMVLPVVISR